MRVGTRFSPVIKTASELGIAAIVAMDLSAEQIADDEVVRAIGGKGVTADGEAGKQRFRRLPLLLRSGVECQDLGRVEIADVQQPVVRIVDTPPGEVIVAAGLSGSLPS